MNDLNIGDSSENEENHMPPDPQIIQSSHRNTNRKNDDSSLRKVANEKANF